MQAQQAEIERLRAEMSLLTDANIRFGKRQDWWNDRMFELEQKIEQLRLDAERYRWLRDPANANANEWNLFGPYSSPKEVDAAIDAAMKEGK